jgi:hypothetical protein
VNATSLLDTIQDGRAISHSVFEDLLAKDFDLVDDYEFMDSWFEVGDEVDAALTGNRATRRKPEALIIEKVLERSAASLCAARVTQGPIAHGSAVVRVLPPQPASPVSTGQKVKSETPIRFARSCCCARATSGHAAAP